jgi:hypothetical protein
MGSLSQNFDSRSTGLSNVVVIAGRRTAEGIEIAGAGAPERAGLANAFAALMT